MDPIENNVDGLPRSDDVSIVKQQLYLDNKTGLQFLMTPVQPGDEAKINADDQKHVKILGALPQELALQLFNGNSNDSEVQHINNTSFTTEKSLENLSFSSAVSMLLDDTTLSDGVQCTSIAVKSIKNLTFSEVNNYSKASNKLFALHQPFSLNCVSKSAFYQKNQDSQLLNKLNISSSSAVCKSNVSSTSKRSSSDSSNSSKTEDLINTENTLDGSESSECSRHNSSLSSDKENIQDDEVDICYYEVLEMLRCCKCSELFLSSADLLSHYKEQHTQSNVSVKIKLSAITKGSDISKKMHESCRQEESPRKFLLTGEIDINKTISGKRKHEEIENLEKKKSKVEETLVPALLSTKSADTMQIYILGEVESNNSSVNTEQNRSSPEQKMPLMSFRRPAKKFRCSTEGCKAAFSTVEHLQMHKKCHRNSLDEPELLETDRKFKCPLCYMTFDKWVTVQGHLWRTHNHDVDMLSCTVCHKYKAATHHLMRKHQEIHSLQKNYKCDECPGEFSQLSQLIIHRNRHHSEKNNVTKKAVTITSKPQNEQEREKRHACPHCDHCCVRLTDLKLHMLRHTDRTPHECKACSQRFRDPSSLRRHVVLKHSDVALLHCPLCSYNTSLSSKFTKHFTARHASHQTEDIQLTFACKLCDETFNSVKLYCQHSLIHRTQHLKIAATQSRNADLAREKEYSSGNDEM